MTLVRLKKFALLAIALLLFNPVRAAAAAPLAEMLLPAETVGFVSIANVPDFQARWNRTQVGKLLADPTMKPFLDQLRDQLTRKAGKIEERLGVTIQELAGAASGEAAFAMVAPSGTNQRATVVVLADVTGNQTEAKKVVAKINARLLERGATLIKPQSADSPAVYSVPNDAGPPKTVAYFLTADRFIAADNEAAATVLLNKVKRGANGQGDPLAKNPSYRATLKKCQRAASGVLPTVTWWVDPFAYDTASRTLEVANNLPRKKDTLTILREEGFDGIKGVGGHILLAVDSTQDVVHRTVVYAPFKPGTTGKPASVRYEDAMRILELPNTSDLGVAPWVPREVAGYKTFNIDIQSAFDYVSPLADALMGYQHAFQTTIDAFEKDPYGPKINLRDEVIAHLGQRVTIMTDYTLPITQDCERYLFVLDVTNEAALRGPIDKWMESDGAERKSLAVASGEGIEYWEIVPEEEASGDLDAGLLSIEGLDDEPVEEEREERVLRRAAVCLHEGKLLIGSDVAFLEKALFGGAPSASLSTSHDMLAASRFLDRLTSTNRCAWAFTRTDESLRPAYEQLRNNQMPESQTFFGRLLNQMLTSDEEEEAHIVRKQTFDGSLLPPFEMARRYFGPAIRAIQSSDDGWMITGVLLSKGVSAP